MKKLLNNVEMPLLGLGVYKMNEPEETIKAIKAALDLGYRAIDTASYYQNETAVGEAIKLSHVPREEIFVTTKVWNDDHGYDETLRAFEKSLEKLGLDYLDLYLTHWPVPNKYVETYRAIERLYEEKLIRVPGVSNHHQEHLEVLENHAQVMPMVNQIECHPYLQQEELINYCKERKIAVTSWAPLGRGSILDDRLIRGIATAYKKTPAQIILRWHLQRDSLIIPKSVRPKRIEENCHIFDFNLSEHAMGQIASLDKNRRTGANPSDLNFMAHFKS